MPQRTETQRRLLTASMALALFVMGLDAGVVNVILPELQSVSETTVSRAMMLATVFMMAMAAFWLTFGRLADQHVGLIVGIKVCGLMALNAVMLVYPFFMVHRLGLNVSGTGLMMLACAVSMALLTPVSGKMTDRYGLRRMLAFGWRVLGPQFPAHARGRISGTGRFFLRLFDQCRRHDPGRSFFGRISGQHGGHHGLRCPGFGGSEPDETSETEADARHVGRSGRTGGRACLKIKHWTTDSSWARSGGVGYWPATG
jgi:MFS family permease